MSDTKNGYLECLLDKSLTLGIKCKACDMSMSKSNADPELCTNCMSIVNDYNRDLDPPDDETLEDFLHAT